MSTSVRIAVAASVAGTLAALWFVGRIGGAPAAPVDTTSAAHAPPAEPSPPDRIESPRALFLLGRFAEARDRHRQLAEGDGREAATARRDLPFFDAVVSGTFDTAIDTLRALHAADHDFDSASRVARLLAMRGDREAALQEALAALALEARKDAKVDLLEFVLTGMPSGPAVDDACGVLLELDPFNVVARSNLFRSAVLHDDFANARTRWRAANLADLLGDEVYDARAVEIDALLPAATEPAARWKLGALFAARRRWVEAAHCLRDATDPESTAWRDRAEKFAVFGAALDRTWIAAFRAGFAEDRWKQAVLDSLPDLCTPLGAASAGELYRLLRDDYGLYLVFLSGTPAHTESEAIEILQIDEIDAPAALHLGRVRRVVTGAARFRMAWALSPLTYGTGAKDLFRSDWPDTLVLHASYSLAQAAEAYEISIGARSDPSAKLPPMADPEAAPGQIASAYMAGNQGNRCFERMRRIVADGLAKPGILEPDGSTAWRDAFVGALARTDLHGAAVHEMRHLADGPLDLDRAESERRAFLTELEFAPVAARYQRLGIVATGGAPQLSGDPYERANLDLVSDFIRTLFKDETIAPQIDRKRNVQAQLHLLEGDEIAAIARRIAAKAEKPK